MSTNELSELEGKLIVSCQGNEGDRWHDPQIMASFAEAAVAGGAAAIRANGPADVRAIGRVTEVPIIGIQKVKLGDGRALITPSFEAALGLVEAGARIIALDCTRRGQEYGALERLKRIRRELLVPVLADVATVEEALTAARAGADCVLSTLRGYTAETAGSDQFELAFIEELVRASPVPVIAEGRIHTPGQASDAIRAGAFAVVIGTAITRPRELARSFSRAIVNAFAARAKAPACVGIDLGGTNTKYGLVLDTGGLAFEALAPTPAHGGQAALLEHLKRVARLGLERASAVKQCVAAIGIATAGWVDVRSGRVAYATDNLPGWTGTAIGEEVAAAVGLPVVVENDANALAIAEKKWGAARGFRDFICVTLGTGLGAGCYVGGKLNRGAHFFANALGHVPLVEDGVACSCGQRGCLESYVNAAALMRYAGESFDSAAEVIAAANRGDSGPVSAVRRLAHYLARGCAMAIQLLDPEAIVLAGGLAEENRTLLVALADELALLVPAWQERHLQVIGAQGGYFGGVLGAAALAMDKADAEPDE